MPIGGATGLSDQHSYFALCLLAKKAQKQTTTVCLSSCQSDSQMANYGEWSLKKLREELRKRKAKQSGRKHELVERLEAYQRNDNFKNLTTETEYQMNIPDNGCFRDLNSDSKVARISFEESNEYLEQLQKSLSAKSNKLADAEFIKYIRWCKTDTHYFLKSEVKAEMRRSVSYTVDIQCDVNGKLLECQCECAAGMGPASHCKHVCAVLYALGKFSDSEIIITERTCTEKLQTFHHVRRKTGSPVKAKNLSMYTNDNIRFDPRPVKYRKNNGYNDYFKSVCINYACTYQELPFPLTQLSEPANVHAIEQDHDYLLKLQSEMFLDEIYERNNKLEELTRQQSDSKLWFEERLVRLTASNFGRICKLSDRTDKHKFAESLTEFNDISTPAMKHGRKYESVAIRKYEELSGNTVLPCGLFVDKAKPYLAATPDGILDENIIVEVKCPKSAHKRPINHVTVPYLKKDGDTLKLAENHNYYYQIQGQLAISDRQMCHFVVWTETDCKVIDIPRNPLFINQMLQTLSEFYDQFFKHAVLNRYFYKNYYSYSFKEE